MKVAIVILGLLACSMAVPVKRQAYRPVMYVPHAQRLMYVQYVQPAQPNARSNGVATFVAGDSVATGSYVKEAPVEETPVEDEAAPALKGNTAQAVAEAYPAPLEDDEEEEGQVADDVAADEAPTAPVADEEEEAQNDAPQDEEAPVVVPVKRYGPKKVYVELDAPADDAEYDYAPPARIPVYAAPQARPTNRPTTKKPQQQGQLPAGTFFPINFGGTNGGAIAIANSFSTGEGGSATSHAVAYGSQDALRARKVAARRH
uniref:DUF4794 domain-containing protein n=1 Tax=Megaselia scalaris TaxID=36166 RepID=T1GDE9_MEGSC